MSEQIPKQLHDALFVESGELPVTDKVEIRGYDFNSGIHYSKILSSFATTGFQASNFALAVKEINKMVTTINCGLKALNIDDF